MAMNVASKTAIITGAGSGINLAFAQLLLEKGCNVVIADLILRPEAEALVAKYPLTSGGAKAVFQNTDVRDWVQLEKMFEVAVEHFGGANIVCPGAGVYEPTWSSFWNPPGSPPSKDDPTLGRYAIVDINITHPIRVTQLAISHFVSQKKAGSIVHISSVAGQSPFFPNPIYVASKHALNGFVRSLADLENPPPPLLKIRVTAVSPALILTPLWTDYPEKMKMISGKTAWVTPGDVAKVMLDLVENEKCVGGTILEVGKTVRKVEALNDPGPLGGENGVIPAEGIAEPAWESLLKQYNGA